MNKLNKKLPIISSLYKNQSNSPTVQQSNSPTVQQSNSPTVQQSPHKVKSIKSFALFASLALASPLVWADAASSPSPIPIPTITNACPGGEPCGTVPHQFPFMSTTVDLAAQGYQEDEYFIEGTASVYTSSKSDTDKTIVPLTGVPLPIDAPEGTVPGEWNNVRACRDAPAACPSTGSAPIWANSGLANYKTRILVKRPIDPAKFNGTVFVEWANVSAGFDISAMWTYHRYLIQDGYAYVSVSTQAQGLTFNGLGIYAPQLTPGLIKWDPTRYESLSIPGDSYSYDIFSQAGQALRNPGAGVDPLGNLRDKFNTNGRLFATGISQSANRLVTYYNAVQRLAKTADGRDVYDAFLPALRTQNGAGSAFLSGSTGTGTPLIGPPGNIFATTGTVYRSDLAAPTLLVQSQYEPSTRAQSYATLTARQPDNSRYVSWEVAGMAHVSSLSVNASSLENIKSFGPLTNIVALCTKPAQDGSMRYQIFGAAIYQLQKWVTTGKAPPTAPWLETDGGWVANVSPRLFYLENFGGILDDPLSPGNSLLGAGNAKGGVRTPQVDVPIATHRGVGEPMTSFVCEQVGTTIPFTTAQLNALYPSHINYALRFSQAMESAVNPAGYTGGGGFFLPLDGVKDVKGAVESSVGAADQIPGVSLVLGQSTTRSLGLQPAAFAALNGRPKDMNGLPKDILKWSISTTTTSCASPTPATWLSVDTTTGPDVIVSFNSTGQSGGDHNAKLCVKANHSVDGGVDIPAMEVPVSMHVDYNIGAGFLPPIDNPTTINMGKAGKTYPVKFQLRDVNGALVSALSAVTSINHQMVACDAFGGSPTDALPEADATGGTALRFDGTQYIFNWKTPSTQACYNLFVTLNSGQVLPAYFDLGK